jgi:effector-binding domain-containing protein
MGYAVRVSYVAAQPLAAARDRMPAWEISGRFRRSLDRVWEYLRAHPGLRTDGHNVFLYRHDMDAAGAMTIDFGVQVSRPFEADGDVRCVMTPAGEVASAVHVGAYDGLKKAHDALQAWIAANERQVGDWSWEIYGNWNDDPLKLQTEVVYLLR